MTNDMPGEGQYVADLIYGRGVRPRSTAPEPALLPHMAARLCHDFNSGAVLDAALTFGHRGKTLSGTCTISADWTMGTRTLCAPCIAAT